MNSLRSLGARALSASLLAAAMTCAHAKTPDDQLIIGVSMNNLLTLDPASATGNNVVEIACNVYDYLVELDANDPTRLLPGLAQEWTIAPDGRRISYADLDFSKQSDVDIMRDRLKNAARDICAKVNRNPRNLSYIPVEERNCIKTTTLESFAQLDGIRASAGRRSASQSAKN